MESITNFSETEIFELKRRAADFYENNGIPEKLEEILNKILYENPKDVYGSLSKYFEGLSLVPTISDLKINTILDCGGNPAFRCDLLGNIKNEKKTLSQMQLSVLPELMVLPLLENDTTEVSNVTIISQVTEHLSEVTEKVKGLKISCQKEIDDSLRTWVDDKEVKLIPAISEITDDENVRTPTPSSGKKKKVPSAKGKGKQPEKQAAPKESFEYRLKGCSIVAAISLAAAKAFSTYQSIPLFQQIYNVTKDEELKDAVKFPTPAISLISGGKTSPGKLNLGKNIFVIAKPGLNYQYSVQKILQLSQQLSATPLIKTQSATNTADGISGGFQAPFEKLEQPIDAIQDAATVLGVTIGNDLLIGIDCSATDIFDYEKGKYEIMTGGLKSADEMVEYYKDITTRYPAVKCLIDPFRKEDREQYQKLCEAISSKCFISSSPVVNGSVHALSENQLGQRTVTSLLLHTGGRAVLSDFPNIMKVAKENEKIVMMGYNALDVCEDSFTDMAVGLQCDVVLLGGPNRGENISRINRLLEIEQYAIQNNIKFTYHEDFKFPVIVNPLEPEVDEAKNTTPSTSPLKSSKKK